MSSLLSSWPCMLAITFSLWQLQESSFSCLTVFWGSVNLEKLLIYFQLGPLHVIQWNWSFQSLQVNNIIVSHTFFSSHFLSNVVCCNWTVLFCQHLDLQYNALGWIFLQVRELSFLEWHPFSVSSSPLDGKNHLAVLIKVLGKWTGNLKDHILSMSEERPETELLLQPGSKITASIEGPYGHESPYHLMYVLYSLSIRYIYLYILSSGNTFIEQFSFIRYENLILVAGGIGISPFLAILSDILHHINQGKPCLPKNILIIWAVKKSDELPLLQTIDFESICPFYSEALNLEIQTYVTRESQPPLVCILICLYSSWWIVIIV